MVLDNVDNTTAEIRIQTLSGGLIYNENYESRGNLLLEMDISNYPPGVYILSVKAEGDLHTQKLIIE